MSPSSLTPHPPPPPQVNEKNKDLKDGELRINLKGIGIGNGLTDPLHQYAQVRPAVARMYGAHVFSLSARSRGHPPRQFPEFAYRNPKKPVVGNFAYRMMKMGATPCTSLIQQCEVCPAGVTRPYPR
jgi:hypothetical protein